MKNDNGNTIHGDWKNLATKAEFNEFQIIGFALYTVTQVTPPTTLSSGVGTSGNASFTTKVRDRVFKFKKGIKRDPASFTVMKDSKQWDSVHRTLKAHTCYQDFDDILDPCYRPTTAEDSIALFAEKQKYMYSVFERTLQTDEGKVVVRSHDSDRNAQLIYSEFLEVMTQSTEALMDSGKLLSYLTTAKISDGSWRGTTKAFVLNWIDKLSLFHELTRERRYQTLKTMTDTLLDRSGSPPYTWLLCLIYVAFLLNLTFNWTIGGTPLQFSEGSTQDISLILRFYWWETVYLKVDDAPFPSTSREESGYFVGISPNVGHAMT
jgi:hypothetical protein